MEDIHLGLVWHDGQ